MTVQEMIDKLQAIENKDMSIYFYDGNADDYPFCKITEMLEERVDGTDIWVLYSIY